MVLKFALLAGVLFFHILDDFCLQGILANMKQRDWWKENASDPLYRNDWVIALIEHAFSWTVMVHIPLVLYMWYTGYTRPGCVLIAAFLCMWAIHAITDHMKANIHLINLITDQLLHIAQIIMLWTIYC